jgi:hypothetical protein
LLVVLAVVMLKAIVFQVLVVVVQVVCVAQ